MSTKFLKAAKEDAQYKKYRRILRQVQERVDIEETKKEALSLHATRTSRNLVGKNAYSTKRLLDAIAKDLSYRARLVEMRQQHSAQISMLTAAIEALHGFLATNYRDYMRGFTNQQARNDALSTVTESGESWNSEARSLIEMLDYFIKDIDQASHAIRHIVDIHKLLDSSKGKIV